MKIASFTFKGKHYVITTSDWFWSRVQAHPWVALAAVACAASLVWVVLT